MKDEGAREFLRAVHVGDVVEGVLASVGRSMRVTLDGFPARPLGEIGPLDVPWEQSRLTTDLVVGRRISALVTAVDLNEERVSLSLAATAHPELWAFLSGLQPDCRLAGTVASIEPYGVFVALDEGPAHPVFPGVGFITYPELSWTRFESASEVVRVGQRVTCVFLQFDTWNGEARLSFRATRPDPLLAFADAVEAAEGRVFRGRVTKLTPIGVFVRVAEGIQGLVPCGTDGTEVADDVRGTVVSRSAGITDGAAVSAGVGVGDHVDVVVTRVEREGRRVTLAWAGRTGGPGRDE
ncbi:S1 RNA-binding domain-containing protein [Streptomyces antibioticus]|uniref:S1 RNA-binding domain-containing protein n=1 Tax=Streptomyces antibioticus TaxID=1890 RepID=UPI003682054F